jgi:MFS transporter, NNP family, nitrate/nitrite transporter
MCQFWSSRMFTKEVVGTANALVGGWGNLGGGVIQLVMGTMLFPLFKSLFENDADKAWRNVCIIPAVVAFITGLAILHFSDDASKGNYKEMKLPPSAVEPSTSTHGCSFFSMLAVLEWNSP